MADQPGISCRKWTLFGLTSVAIIVQIVVVIISCNLIDDLAKDNSTITNQDWEDAKKQAKTIIIAIGVVGILIQMLGLLGAYKENYCLTLTYAILMTLATIGAIVQALQESIGWASFVFYLLITILAYLFARDIKRLRSTQPVMPVYGA